MQNKKLITTLLFAILSIFIITACSNNSGSSVLPEPKVETVKAFYSHIFRGGRDLYDIHLYSQYAITEDGSLYAWGDNSQGQLGIEPTGIPSADQYLEQKNKKKVYLYDYVYQKVDRLWWPEFSSSYYEKDCGMYTTYAITEDGSLYAWGSNRDGQLGVDHVGDYSYTPVKVDLPSKIKDITSSYYSGFLSIFAILEDGSLYAWGGNDVGQLGVGDNLRKNIRTKVNLPGKIKELIKRGDSSFYAILEDGSLYAWGYNFYGCLGVGDSANRNIPTKVDLPGSIKELLARGNGSTYAILEDGSLYAWGNNYNGYLGVGDNVDRNIPTKVDLPDKIKELRIFDISCFAILEDGSLYAWSYNYYGQLGVGDNVEKNIPTKVNLPSKIKDITSSNNSGSYLSIFAILEDGSLYSWGSNRSGQLGVGDDVDRNIPTKVDLPGSIKELLVNTNGSTYAILEDGSLYAWGYNYYGYLGVGDNVDINIPTKVDLPGKIKELVNDNYSIFAILEDGSLYSWGYNYYGQLGVGDSVNRNIPIKVNLPDKINQFWVNVGERTIYGNIIEMHSIYAILEDGSHYTWGYNYEGQLGVGSTTESITEPTLFTDISGTIKQTEYSDKDSYFLTNDGLLYGAGFQYSNYPELIQFNNK